jgi:hypothetical protein
MPAKTKRKRKTKPKAPPAKWNSRIVGEGSEAPDQLLANPDNWRIHPDFQQKALQGVLDEVGWVQRIIVNEATGHVVDGHLRVMLAMQNDEPLVPVLYVNLTPAEEKKILLSLDPISALAAHDELQVHRLQMEVETDSEALRAALNDIVRDKGEIERLKKRDDSIMELTNDPDAVFLSNNRWGIPELVVDELAKDDCIPDTTWDGGDLDADYTETCMFVPYDKMGWFGDDRMAQHIVNFYIADTKFEVLWNRPRASSIRLLKARVRAAVQPDYSLWGDVPDAVKLYNVYRSYWVSVYWQQCGIPVIPSLMIGGDDTWEYCLEPMPEKPPIMSFQCRTSEQDKYGEKLRKAYSHTLHVAMERIQPTHCLVYGGTDHPWIVKALPTGPTYHLVPSYTEARRWRMDTEQQNRHGDPPTRMSGSPSELASQFAAKGEALN